MKKAIVLIAILAIATSIPIPAQQPTSPLQVVNKAETGTNPTPATTAFAGAPAPAVPDLTSTEKMALGSIQQSYNQLLQLIQSVDADIRHDHPGFELDPLSPLSGKLVAVPKPPAPPAAPAK